MEPKERKREYGPPLLEIQRCEVEAAAWVAAAESSAQERCRRARSEAQRIRQQAEDAGRREGEADYQRLLSAAGAQAEDIVQEAQREAAALEGRRSEYVAAMAAYALDVLLEREGLKEAAFA